MQDFQLSFPNLTSENHVFTSPKTPDYNCIAWAAEESDRWWWPIPVGVTYWPNGVVRAETVASFIDAFMSIGYVVCDTSDFEIDFQKVAIFVSLSDVPTHMARQLDNGNWTSKLGSSEDISHATLDTLIGPIYGRVSTVMKRKKQQSNSPLPIQNSLTLIP